MTENTLLGKDGLTVTSANHLANIAKEMYEAIEQKLESLKLYSRDYMLAVNSNSFRVENESGKDELETLEASLKEIGELKSLIAYLREAIKAKMELDTDAAFDEHVERLIKEGREDLARPKEKKEVRLCDEFAKLTAEQKARYYALEAKCSTIGAFIHPDGVFATARQKFFEHLKDPITVAGRGQDAELSAYTTSFTVEEVDGAFFALQREYRTLQAEFNKMKADLDAKVAEQQKADAAEKLAAHRLWLDALGLERLKYKEAVKALKVVIPQNLRAIYEKVNAVASAK